MKMYDFRKTNALKNNLQITKLTITLLVFSHPRSKGVAVVYNVMYQLYNFPGVLLNGMCYNFSLECI